MNQAYGDVLIIDGDIEYHQDYKKLFKAFPQVRNIVFAHDGVQGLFKLNNQEFMAVILSKDVTKKPYDEVIRGMKEIKTFSLGQVLFVSNRCPKEELEYVVNLGIKNIVLKPFVEENFVTKMKPLIK